MRHLSFWGLGFLCLACGGSSDNPFGDGGNKDATTMGDVDDKDGGTIIDTGIDTGVDTFTCDGLECQIPKCMNMDGTTITGTVFDPAGKNTIYNAFVYIPNRPLDPIPSGTPSSCTQCMAPASGKPLVSAVTDAKGNFTLKNVPAGANIPIVVQVGKWRHKDVIANVTPCMPNMALKTTTSLPSKQPMGTDDNIPQIALQTGCDMAECFLQRTVGIDASEFTGPTGKGRVHVYRGMDDNQQFASTPGNAYTLWADVMSMKKYDMLFNTCECSPYDRQNNYTNMKSYLDAGGRMFGSHYHYNWFAPPTGPMDFQSQAPWLGNVGFAMSPFPVDTSHPRGQAFSDWLQANSITMQAGQLQLTDTRNDVQTLNNNMPGHGTYSNTTGWVYSTQNQTLYLTFNTPTTAMTQCGRAAFSDIHVSGTAPVGMFPQYCPNLTADLGNEKAMEFLFFDLFGCVQDDTKAPISPPTQ